MAIRAVTARYDLFRPTSLIVWHDYHGHERRRHWDDHVGGRGLTEWWTRDSASKAKVREFLPQPYIGRYACGRARPFAAYEAYAWLYFNRRRAQDYTRRHEEPPNRPMPAVWADSVRRWRTRITLRRASLPVRVLSDSSLWYVGFHDAAAREIYRADAQGSEFDTLICDQRAEIVIEREFESSDSPQYSQLNDHPGTGRAA